MKSMMYQIKDFIDSLVSHSVLKCKLKENLVNYTLFDQIDKCKIISQNKNEVSFLLFKNKIKLAENLNKHFFQKKHTMDNSYIERCSK